MPLLRFDLIKGRSPLQLRRLLDVTHDALVTSSGVHRNDRYQVVTEHGGHQIVAEDTRLGFQRTDKLVVLEITTRPHSAVEKQDLYARLDRELRSECGIEPNDLIISIVENTNADWSFRGGEVQFLTGRLTGKSSALAHDTR